MATAVDVLIIGAGASGLTAAHDLIDVKDSGLNVKILEARDRIGGRTAKLAGFADDNVPIDLGGEWLATDKSFLDDIAGTSSSSSNTLSSMSRTPSMRMETITWYPTEYLYNEKDGSWDDPMARESMLKFVNSTWYDFFATFIATDTVMDNVIFDCAVTTVDHSNTVAPVIVQCEDGRVWSAQQLIVTVPIPVLQQDLMFIPGLPDEHQDAIDKQGFLPGLKVMLHFEEKFYHDVFMLSKWDYNKESGNYFYNPFFNAPHDVTKPKNVLIASVYGEEAADYVTMSDTQLVNRMIQELDEAYGNNLASNNLLNSHVHNWNNEQFTQGIYSNGQGFKEAATLREPTPDGTIIFAGEAIPPEGVYYGYVHGAAYSGRRAADLITALPLYSDPPTPSPPTKAPAPLTFSNEGDFPLEEGFYSP